jgi:SulP family sulfate permease
MGLPPGTDLLHGLIAPGLLSLEGNPLLIGPIRASGTFADSLRGQFHSILRIGIADLGLVGQSALALSALLAIDTLKTCVVLDAITKGRHDSNRRLTRT